MLPCFLFLRYWATKFAQTWKKYAINIKEHGKRRFFYPIFISLYTFYANLYYAWSNLYYVVVNLYHAWSNHYYVVVSFYYVVVNLYYVVVNLYYAWSNLYYVVVNSYHVMVNFYPKNIVLDCKSLVKNVFCLVNAGKNMVFAPQNCFCPMPKSKSGI